LQAVTRVFLDAALRANPAALRALAGNSVISEQEAIVTASLQGAAPWVALPNAPEPAGFAELGFFPFTQAAAAYNRSFFHETSGYVGVWQGTPGAFSVPVDASPTAPQAIAFRVAQVSDPRNDVTRFMNVDVELTDATGKKATAKSDWALAHLPPVYRRPPAKDPYDNCKVDTLEKTVLGSVRIPLSCFAAQPGFDRTAIRLLRVTPRETPGALAFTEVQLEP